MFFGSSSCTKFDPGGSSTQTQNHVLLNNYIFKFSSSSPSSLFPDLDASVHPPSFLPLAHSSAASMKSSLSSRVEERLEP